MNFVNKIVLVVVLFLIVFPSCQKRKCKDQQDKEMVELTEKYQKEISNIHLTAQQVEELTRRFQQEQQEY